MNQAQTQLFRQGKSSKQILKFRTAVSLHSHTRHSKENLGFLPRYIEYHRTPVVSRLLQAELKRYEESKGKKLDFHRAYWTPPVTPDMVLASETRQIEKKLGLAPLVSITDHDTIAGPLSLRAQPATAWVPVSVEWTIPCAGNFLHVGVHNLPPERSEEIMKELASYTAQPRDGVLADLLAVLDSFPETLLVLNHPFHNIYRVKGDKHLSSLRQFMARCRPWIHGIEINGMRSWGENQDVQSMAEEYDLPIIAGGDRHGRSANTVLNLTQAETLSDFIRGVREDRRNSILMLCTYEEPAPLRELATARDVLRNYPHYPYGQRRFTDRIFLEMEGYGWHPLSFYWDGGDGRPKWLSPVVRTVIALGSDPVRPILRRVLTRPTQFDSTRWPQQGDNSDGALGARAEVAVESE